MIISGPKTQDSTINLDLERQLENVYLGKYKDFRNFLENNKITYLDLSRKDLKVNSKNRITPSQIFHVLRALNDTKVTELNLANNFIGEDGAKLIKHALRVSSLTAINFSYTGLGYAGVKIIERAMPKNTITINFAGNNIKNIGARVIARMMRSLPTVTSLVLSDNELGAPGAETIAKELVNKENDMILIDLSNNSLKDKGTQIIVKSLFKNVETLNLAYNTITDVGARSFQGMGAQVKHLNLAGNKISDAGAKSISKMEDAFNNDSLISLNLSENPINNSGGIALSNKFVGVVKEIDLSHSSLRDDGALTMLNILLRKHPSITNIFALPRNELSQSVMKFIPFFDNLFKKGITLFIKDKPKHNPLGSVPMAPRKNVQQRVSKLNPKGSSTQRKLIDLFNNPSVDQAPALPLLNQLPDYSHYFTIVNNQTVHTPIPLNNNSPGVNPLSEDEDNSSRNNHPLNQEENDTNIDEITNKFNAMMKKK